MMEAIKQGKADANTDRDALERDVAAALERDVAAALKSLALAVASAAELASLALAVAGEDHDASQ